VLAARLAPRGIGVSVWPPLSQLVGERCDELAVETAAGWAQVGSSARGFVRAAPHVAAAWTSDADPLADTQQPTRRDVRAGAFIRASRAGLEISRGPFGGQSLYYAHDKGALLVSSRLAPLLDCLSRPPALDPDRLAAMTVGAIGPDPRATLYRGVRRLLPCETRAFMADGERSWFDLPTVPAQVAPDPRAHVRAMREALTASVARSLRGYRAVGVSAGGGLDSGGLLALVAEHAAKTGTLRFTGVTVEFAGPGDDRPHLAALLSALHASTLRVRPGTVGPLGYDLFVADGAPYTWPTSPLDVVAGRLAKAWGAEAILTGMGGDQILDGDDMSFARRARGGDLRAIVEATRLQVPYASTRRRRLARFIVKPLLRNAIPLRLLERRRARMLASSAQGHWAGPRLRSQLTESLNVPPPLSEDWLTGYATCHHTMEIADGRQQTETAWGIPQINPYLDRDFIDLVASFPPEELFLGGMTRGMFREAMTGLLPDSMRLRRDKAGFEPMVDGTFLDFGGVDGFRPLLTMEATADLGIVDPVAFRACFDRIVRGERTPTGWLDVWPALTVEAFLRGSRTACAAEVSHDAHAA
jgi:asparagine synthase (glutamine-hydrolysing)